MSICLYVYMSICLYAYMPICLSHMLIYVDNPSCVDLILTNKSSYFQHSISIESGLSDFHKLTITMMKAGFQKLQPKILKVQKL